jgi:hypothetical protein
MRTRRNKSVKEHPRILVLKKKKGTVYLKEHLQLKIKQNRTERGNR